MSDESRNVIRVLFQNIESGDRRKFEARSNNSKTGGGARDLRFRPEDAFLSFFRKVLPSQRFEEKTSRKGGIERREILSGIVFWFDGEEEKSAPMEVWSATRARPGECRIARISSFDLYDLIKDDPADGRSVFMIFQQKNGVTRLFFTTETSLRNDDWDPAIKKLFSDWVGIGSKSAFLDFETMERYV